jgi:hypothetical protein
VSRSMALSVCIVLIATGVCVGGNNPGAKVAVHVVAHFAKRNCTNSFPSINLCSDVVYALETGDADCFPVFFNLQEYRGVEYGLDWPGTYTCTFTSCSDFAIGDIVNPGDGIDQVWVDCQPGHVAIPGWAWIYEPDSALVCVVVHPLTFEINVLDCSDGLDEPADDPFCAGIAGAQGDDPCDYPVASDESTWGSIKSLFR